MSPHESSGPAAGPPEERAVAALEARLAARDAEVAALREQVRSLEETAQRSAELSQANRSLRQANVDIREQSRCMLEHFACMSHEIRTPLNCIVGMASLLLDTPLNQFQQEAVRMITTSGDLLSTIVDDVLDHSRLEAGEISLDVRPDVDLQLTLDSVTTAIQMKADQAGRGLWVRSYIGVNVPQFWETDRQRLSQILYNLMGNAVKFSRDDGYIDLMVDICAPELGGEAPECLRFRVKDYGKGIADRDFAKIFEPFQQVNDESGDVYGGTGLGLPITAKLVEKLNGRIAVKSEVEKWTEFTVEFPFHGQEVTCAELECQRARLDHTTVLVVVARPTTDCPVGQWLSEQHIPVKLMLSCSELEETVAQLEAQDSPGQPRYYITLMQDEAFDVTLYGSFAEKHKSLLLTFGYKGVEMAAAHIQVPCRVFPSIFMPILGDLVDRLKTGKIHRIETGVSSSILIVRGQPEVVPTRTAPISKKNDYSSLRILIAEDNKVNQKVLTKTLNRLNLHNIEVVENGSLAVQAANEKVYDLILMDMEMPVMDGVEACRIINKHKCRMLPVVVFVTAHALEAFRKEASDAGGHGFISKPFNLDRIRELIESIPWDKLTETELRTLAAKKQVGCQGGLTCIPQSEIS